MGSNNLIRKRRNRAGAMPPLLSVSYVPRQTLAERQNPLLVCICPQTRRQSFAVDRLSPSTTLSSFDRYAPLHRPPVVGHALQRQKLHVKERGVAALLRS